MVERRPAHRWGVTAQRALLVSLMVWSSTGLAAQYPSGPQVAKDGTAVLLQDYVSLPVSSRTSGW